MNSGNRIKGWAHKYLILIDFFVKSADDGKQYFENVAR
jgi:hypothetical protein